MAGILVAVSDAPPDPYHRRARRVVDDAYGRADRVLDYGQLRVFRLLWFFVPQPAIAREPRFQQVLASRFLSDAGQQGLAYGALIAVVRNGGSALEAAFVGVAALLPAAALGLYGGAIADALPKRIALAATYNLQALICFLIPTVIGTDLSSLVLLVFAVNTLGQISGPTESSVVPLIASETELASAASLVNLASAAGGAVGTAILAPVLVRAFGVDIVMYVAGAFLLLAASRVFDLPSGERERPIDWRMPKVSVRRTIAWLADEPAVGTILLVGVLAGTVNVVIQTLAPRYVQSTLHVDAADAVYVFAPSAAGLVLALVAAPSLMKRWGERVTAIWAFLVAAVSLFALGLVDQLSGPIDPVNPLRLLEAAGLDMEESLRTAGLLAFPLGFGVALAITSVQTYINRRVPMLYQGRTFALQSTLKNGAAIIPLLALGGAAAAFGVEKVLLASPFVLLALAWGLLAISARLAGFGPPTGLHVLTSFWEEPGGTVAGPGSDEPAEGNLSP